MRITILSLLALVVGALPVSAKEPTRLLAAADGDLVVGSLQASKRKVSSEIERQPVQFSWALDSRDALQPAQPHVAESREFWTLLSTGQQKAGYRFAVTAPGALLRVSPAEAGRASKAGASDLQLAFNERRLQVGNGLLRVADDQQLKALGADFGVGTRVFQLDPALGAGSLTLTDSKAGGRVLLHVAEPNSPFVLSLATDRDTVGAKGRLGVYVNLLGPKGGQALSRVSGLLTGPGGESVDLQFELDAKGRGLSQLTLPANASSVAGLWEVHVFAAGQSDKGLVQRDAKTSFALTPSHARLSGEVEVQRDTGLQLKVGVQAATEGRYELRSVLYGTNRKGALVPFAAAHAAQWMDAGNGQITLQVEQSLIESAGVVAPFELRDLSLNDQVQISRIESRARALRIEH